LLHEGADAQLLLQDILDVLYGLICLKTVPQFQQDVWGRHFSMSVHFLLLVQLELKRTDTKWFRLSENHGARQFPTAGPCFQT
jgi:hypothetical protein